MEKYVFNDYVRIDKRVAKKLYNAGCDIIFTPNKTRPNSLLSMELNKNLWGDYKDFENVCNQYHFYNCNYNELGYYIAFYIDKKSAYYYGIL